MAHRQAHSLETRARISASMMGLHRSPETRAKIGASRTVPTGTESLRPCRDRVFVKVEGGGWTRRAHLVWEEANGPIPSGHLIHHINRDTADDRLENLMAMSNGEHTQFHRRNET